MVDMSGARALMRQVADLNRVMNGGQSQLSPDARAVKAATELYLKIKSWPESVRQLIDSLDARVSGDLGDFLIDMDRVVRSIRNIEG